MKALIITSIGVLFLIFWSGATKPTPEDEAEAVMEHAECTNDSALVYLKMIHDKNDSLLGCSFPKEN
jgi:hypothetical protein